MPHDEYVFYLVFDVRRRWPLPPRKLGHKTFTVTVREPDSPLNKLETALKGAVRRAMDELFGDDPRLVDADMVSVYYEPPELGGSNVHIAGIGAEARKLRRLVELDEGRW